MSTSSTALERCSWARQDPLLRDYHDREWGVPEHDDRRLFELLTLEGAQAGLSWRTVLAKRERYREVFHGFAIARVAAMEELEIEDLVGDAGLIRHRGKLGSVRDNARAALALIEEYGSLAAYLWSFVEGKPQRGDWISSDQVPASTELSERLSKALRKRGFRFVGPTICYSFLQASGMVDDHLQCCFRHASAASIVNTLR